MKSLNSNIDRSLCAFFEITAVILVVLLYLIQLKAGQMLSSLERVSSSMNIQRGHQLIFN